MMSQTTSTHNLSIFSNFKEKESTGSTSAEDDFWDNSTALDNDDIINNANDSFSFPGKITLYEKEIILIGGQWSPLYTTYLYFPL